MEWFFMQCRAGFFQEMPVLMSLFLTGAAGSLAHCSLMCAPAIAAQKMAGNTSFYAYHAGRATTYALLGALASAAAGILFSADFTRISHLVIFAAGILFLFSALRPTHAHAACAQQARTDRLLGRVEVPAGLRSYLRGMMMGFMPCGMVLAALMLASTTGSAALAATGMALFALATVPVLQLTGSGLARLGRLRPAFAGRGMMAANGLFLCALGASLITVS